MPCMGTPKIPSPPPAKCGARTRHGSGTCAHTAGWGTDHPGYGRCKMHGGSSPGGRVQGQRLEAAHIVDVWGIEVETTPGQALLDLCRAKASEVAWWQTKVAALSPTERTNPAAAGHANAAVHPTIDSLHHAQDQLAAYAAACLRAGVDAALVVAAQTSAQDLVQTVRAALTAAGITDPSAQIAAVRAALTAEDPADPALPPA